MLYTYIRVNVKYIDGKWRKETVNMDSHSQNRKYAIELAEMLRHFFCKGNILAYTVAVVTSTRNGEYADVIRTEV